MYCVYYRANVDINMTWFFVATFRALESIAFDRTLDKTTGLFEFFVPQDQEQRFISVMNSYQASGLITNLTKLPNRLSDPHSIV